MRWYVLTVLIPGRHDIDARGAQIRFLQSKLSLAFWSNLTRYVHDLYL